MNAQMIEGALRDYHWMIREIERLRDMMKTAEGGNMAAQYGVESTLPKAQGVNTDPVSVEVIRRDRQWKRINKLEQRVSVIQERMQYITNERERTVLDCMMDGMSIVAISRHMGLSRRHIHRIKDTIVDRMSHMSHMSQLLPDEKQCC